MAIHPPSRRLHDPLSASGGRLLRVSVVVPTYNRCDKLRQCILGLQRLQLEGLDVDVRIQDDGSTDGTEALVRELLASYDGPVRFHYQRQENQGPAVARNAGIMASDASFVAFIDDDCIPEPQWLRELVGGFTAALVAGVGGKCRPAPAHTHVARYFNYRGANEYPSERRPFEFPLGGNSAYRRDVLLQFGGYNALFREAAAEDIDLAWRIKQAGGYRFTYQPNAVVLDHNVETVAQLVGRALDRGREKAVKRAVRDSRGAVTWSRALRDGGAALLFLLRPLLLPVHVVGLLRRGVEPHAVVPVALLDSLYRFLLRWGRFRTTLDLVTGREQLDRSAPVAPEQKIAAGP